MAEKDFNPGPRKQVATSAAGVPARGLVCERCIWGDLYTGKREAVLASGLVAPSHLPGSALFPEKRSVLIWNGVVVVARGRRLEEMEDAGGLVRVVRSSKHTYRVHVVASREERQARISAGKDAGRIRATAEFVQQTLAALPTSAEEFRHEVVRAYDSHMGAVLALSDGGLGRHGFRFTKHIREEVLATMRALRSTLLAGGIEFDAGLDAAGRQRILSEGARSDPAVQRLIANATVGAALARAAQQPRIG